jgi:hypothetical protein
MGKKTIIIRVEQQDIGFKVYLLRGKTIFTSSRKQTAAENVESLLQQITDFIKDELKQ